MTRPRRTNTLQKIESGIFGIKVWNQGWVFAVLNDIISVYFLKLIQDIYVLFRSVKLVFGISRNYASLSYRDSSQRKSTVDEMNLNLQV